MSQIVSSVNTEGGNVAFSHLEGTRIVYINDRITSSMAYYFNTTLLKLEQENAHEDITVYINSPGGSVIDGLSMIDTMNLISCDVSTICVGLAASMGAMILMSGTKGKRKMLPHSEVLIHQPLKPFGEGVHQASDVQIMANDLLRTKQTLYEMIQEATGQPYEKIEKDCDRDYILNAKEALEYGIVDSIIKSHK